MVLVLLTCRLVLQKVVSVVMVSVMLWALFALKSERTVSRGRFMLMVRTSIRAPDRPLSAELFVTLS